MQPRISTKVSDMLGDGSMKFICDCGYTIERAPLSNKAFIGCYCGNCNVKWTAIHPVDEDGQAKLFCQFHRCHCGSNSLNRAPGKTTCICEPGDAR